MRLFWLGNHKILVKTELPRLRGLGYEVFNPPVISSNQLHQSASSNWEEDQPSTLPKEVFQELSQLDFFSGPLCRRASEILDTYFDVVIVTIDPSWLSHVLCIYNGPVIYRTYGHVHNMSEFLWHDQMLKVISERDNFYYMPHAIEAALTEHSWLREREYVVPYIPDPSIFKYKNTWDIDTLKEKEVMLMCPNLQNPYYKNHYYYLKKNFPFHNYKFYGVQPESVNDEQVVGTLDFDKVLKRYSEVSCFLYTFKEPGVCFLPPIEMMIAGGPVLFLAGSLLDSYFGNTKSPGRCETEVEAIEKCNRLVNGDKKLAQSIIDSQKIVVEKYDPEKVWPLFDKGMKEVLEDKINIKGRKIYFNKDEAPSVEKERIYMIGHFHPSIIAFNSGEYHSGEGILRVMRLVMNSILEHTEFDVVITCSAEGLQKWNGFFSSDFQRRRVQFLVVDRNIGSKQIWFPDEENINDNEDTQLIESNVISLKKVLKKIIPEHSLLFRGLRKVYRMLRLRADSNHTNSAEKIPSSPSYVDFINLDVAVKAVFVPHYYLFEESLNINKSQILYLPDYSPHFFENKLSFGADQLSWEETGRKIADKASLILTNSFFSKSYLPECALKVEKEKIRVVYLPMLNTTLSDEKENFSEGQVEIKKISEKLNDKKYCFYPTQFRPNKNIPFLFDVFKELKKRDKEVYLVLTCEPTQVENIIPNEIRDRVLIYPKVSDSALAWLYKHTSCLTFTSTMEGNFPPQIMEALYYEAPILAIDMPLIKERMINFSKGLELVKELNVKDYVEKLEDILDSSEELLIRQRDFYNEVLRQGDKPTFSKNVSKMFLEI